MGYSLTNLKNDLNVGSWFRVYHEELNEIGTEYVILAIRDQAIIAMNYLGSIKNFPFPRVATSRIELKDVSKDLIINSNDSVYQGKIREGSIIRLSFLSNIKDRNLKKACFFIKEDAIKQLSYDLFSLKDSKLTSISLLSKLSINGNVSVVINYSTTESLNNSFVKQNNEPPYIMSELPIKGGKTKLIKDIQINNRAKKILQMKDAEKHFNKLANNLVFYLKEQGFEEKLLNSLKVEEIQALQAKNLI